MLDSLLDVEESIYKQRTVPIRGGSFAILFIKS